MFQPPPDEVAGGCGPGGRFLVASAGAEIARPAPLTVHLRFDMSCLEEFAPPGGIQAIIVAHMVSLVADRSVTGEPIAV